MHVYKSAAFNEIARALLVIAGFVILSGCNYSFAFREDTSKLENSEDSNLFSNENKEELSGQKEFSFHIDKIASLSSISSNINMFSTAIAYYDGSIYTANVEKNPEKNGALITVVRKGTPNSSGEWRWDSYIIDDDTFNNAYHTQPSIAVDKLGYVHVAYNMHNMPWQYSISKRPGDISEFQFRGDPITPEQKDLVRQNKTPFPSLGTAAIPGNQITYPKFFHDRNGELYVTYRFATRPKRSFQDRGFAGGVARYDTATKTWESLGGEITVTSDDADLPEGAKTASIRAFAYTDQWSVYLIWLAFDEQNNMHVSWLWREGGAGPNPSHPSYAYSSDGGHSFTDSRGSGYSLPISVQQSELFIANAKKSRFGHRSTISIGPDNTPYIYTEDINNFDRVIVHNVAPGEWSEEQPLPEGASEVMVDKQGHFWAFATGPKVFVRDTPGGEWRNLYREEKGYGYFRTLEIPQERKILLYSMNDSEEKVNIYLISY